MEPENHRGLVLLLNAKVNGSRGDYPSLGPTSIPLVLAVSGLTCTRRRIDSGALSARSIAKRSIQATKIGRRPDAHKNANMGLLRSKVLELSLVTVRA